MSVYNVDNEGVEALNNAAKQVSESCETLMNLLDNLVSSAGDNPEGLGPHTAQLAAAIEETRAAVENSKAPAEEVSGSLRALAQSYQDIIDNNPFTDFEKSNKPSDSSSASVYNPRSLEKTAQTWTKGIGETLTYNSPIETGKMLDCCQGKVNGFEGTCGLCSCENVLRMAGIPVTEADIVNYASITGLCFNGFDPSSNGGTSATDRKKYLNISISRATPHRSQFRQLQMLFLTGIELLHQFMQRHCISGIDLFITISMRLQ